jgi:phosphatidylglycerol:prolipoprotein diacylglycerol transferase
MHPELFRIPFTELTVKTYGLLMVVGFIAAINIIRRLSRSMGQQDAEHITTAALYSLIAGVAGARIFYVIHYWSDFQGKGLLSVFAVWDGGLELLGGVFLSIFVIVLYLYVQKLPIRRYLDILAIGLLLALGFGRIGCFFSGCCFGRPTTCPVAIRFPYGSNAYQSQVRPNAARDRLKPYTQLPPEFFGYINDANSWTVAPQLSRFDYYLKPFDRLTEQEKSEVTTGPYRCLPVWPTELFESFLAFTGCLILYLHRRKSFQLLKAGGVITIFYRPGVTFALMFIVYGIMRFFMEFLRDDNPFGADELTISQNLSIGMEFVGFFLIWLFGKMKPDKFSSK